MRAFSLGMALVVAGVVPATPAAAAPKFRIGLIGDTGYSAGDDKLLLETQRSMATYNLAFEAHDGDIQLSGSKCSDARLNYVRGVFNGFKAPFVYTPGDNEWFDCPDPDARLAAIRRIFFSTGRTLGETTMPVIHQPGTPENFRWNRGGVYFATLDVPGPAGGGPRAADLAWLNGTFDAAEAAHAAAVMIIWQDDPFLYGADQTLVSALKNRTKSFGKPVVLVHGDTHKYRLDKPWKDVPNFTRVETYAGDQSNKWVLATIDPGTKSVFSFNVIVAK
ncbi:MAG TPA: hypothetical protein VGO87_05600 [Acidimicrobiia bacterium]